MVIGRHDVDWKKVNDLDPWEDEGETNPGNKLHAHEGKKSLEVVKMDSTRGRHA